MKIYSLKIKYKKYKWRLNKYVFQYFKLNFCSDFYIPCLCYVACITRMTTFVLSYVSNLSVKT